MGTQTVERDAVERPTVNGWLVKPTAAQTRYATELCKTELPYAERVATIASFPALDRSGMSALIDTLKDVRERRMARLRKARRGQRR